MKRIDLRLRSRERGVRRAISALAVGLFAAGIGSIPLRAGDPVAEPAELVRVLERLQVLSGAGPAGNGDVDGNGRYDVSDAIHLLNWLFNGGPPPVPLSCAGPPPAAVFEELPGASVHFEYNATDGDADVVFEVGSLPAAGRLRVYDPLDREVLALELASDAVPAGGGDFEIEDDDPPGSDEVLIERGNAPLAITRAWYPPGEYLISVETFDGRLLAGLAELEHALPEAPEPSVEIDAAARTLRIAWYPVPGASSYEVEVEQDKLGLRLEIAAGASREDVTLPMDLFAPGAEYKLSLTAVAPSGNRTSVEKDFTLGIPGGDPHQR